ncbi:chalcone isomerase family protein [Pseudomonas sp. zbq_18]|uniref:chalcone isomerase family protein n=1 Tax=Pseudomonas sp. zbq_18 TaxID=3367251 RepID=UPI00370C70EF
MTGYIHWLRRAAFLAALVLSLNVPALPAQGQWRSQLPDARLVGAGEFTWFGFTVYTARLWSPAPQVDFNQPFVLELTYRRDISRDTLVKASLDEMRRVADVDPATLAGWEDDLRLAFPDVKAGQRIAGEYRPGQGGRFYLDGQLRQEIADPEFAKAFFAIWLDTDTRSPELRRALLGLNTERSR